MGSETHEERRTGLGNIRVRGSIPVSVIVMTRNEADNIVACLSGLSRFDEVFVVDSNSTDGTVALAASMGARVVPFTWNGRYPKKKQWCLNHLPFRHDRVFFVDADERVLPALADEIEALMVRGPKRAGYFVTARMSFDGHRLRFGHHNCKLALFDRKRGHFPECPDLDVTTMWEVEGHYQPTIDGPTERLTAYMLHEDGKPVSAWFERHELYADWEATLGFDGRLYRLASAEPPLRRLLKRAVQRLPLRPLLAFLHSYVWRLGFLDGSAGYRYAKARGWYYRLIDRKTAAMRSLKLSPHRPTP
ncbi:MAG: glycosyltransferase family 2 protein [Rhodospirillaceae bacterium]